MEEGDPNNSAIELGASLKAKMDSAIVQHLIDNILSAVATEASLLTGVRDAIEDVQHELTRMRSFLIDADKRGASSAEEETSLTCSCITSIAIKLGVDLLGSFTAQFIFQRLFV